MADVPHALVGEVVDTGQLQIIGVPCPIPDDDGRPTTEIGAPLVVEAEINELKEAWRKPLSW